MSTEHQGHGSVPSARPRYDIADIVRRHRAELAARRHLSSGQRKVLSAIAQCRTSALGCHLDVCPKCNFERPAYNSCRNRHCPKCQVVRQETWIAARTARLLSVGHFHVVLTLPSSLRPLAQYAPREVLGVLFAAAREILLELGRTRFGAQLGITMVLHTWTRDLRYHPHVHAIVTAGGLALDGSNWCGSSPKYLFPVQIMGKLLRGKVLEALRRLHAKGAFARFSEFEDPEGFDRLMCRLAAAKRWIVYAKRPFKCVDHIVKYLGRYTHRVGISNSRIVELTEHAVTFKTHNGKTCTITPVEFLERFVKHVLPDGFHKIRHYGLYASAAGTARQAAQTYLVAKRITTDAQAGSVSELLRKTFGHELGRCPHCGCRLRQEHLPSPSRNGRAPPQQAAA